MYMLDVVLNEISKNSNKIDSISKSIIKSNKIFCFEFIIIGLTLYKIGKKVNNQQKIIIKMKSELDAMKSKGE